MNRWKMRGAAAMAVLALAIAGCQQETTDPADDGLTSPSMDMSMPATTDDAGATDAGTSPGTTDDGDLGTSPSPTTSP